MSHRSLRRQLRMPRLAKLPIRSSLKALKWTTCSIKLRRSSRPTISFLRQTRAATMCPVAPRVTPRSKSCSKKTKLSVRSRKPKDTQRRKKRPKHLNQLQLSNQPLSSNPRRRAVEIRPSRSSSKSKTPRNLWPRQRAKNLTTVILTLVDPRKTRSCSSELRYRLLCRRVPRPLPRLQRPQRLSPQWAFSKRPKCPRKTRT